MSRILGWAAAIIGIPRQQDLLRERREQEEAAIRAQIDAQVGIPRIPKARS